MLTVPSIRQSSASMKSLLSKVDSTKSESLSIISAPLRIAGSGLFALAFMTAIWTVTAKIPIKINATGVLTPVDGLFVYRAQSSGRLLYPFKIYKNTGELEFEAPAWSRKAYDFTYNTAEPSFSQAEELATQILGYIPELQTQRIPPSVIGSGASFGHKYQIELDDRDIVAIIDIPSLRQALKDNLLNLQKSTANYQRLLLASSKIIKDSSDVARAKASLIEPMASLNLDGYVSRVELLQAQADAAAQNKEVEDLKQQLSSIKLQAQQERLKLIESLTDFIQQSIIFSHDHAFLKTMMASQWEYVSTGTEVAAVSWSDKSDPTIIPIFYDQKSATEIAIGQKVILTPLGFSAAEVGGIVGEVISIDPFPYTQNALSQKLKSEGLAQVVSPSGASYLANVRLATTDANRLRATARSISRFRTSDNRLYQSLPDGSADTTGGYKWNNLSKPPLAPREGFIMTAQVTTRTVTPLQMVIPLLKELTGRSPITQLVRTQLNQP